jgi:hypothetical protein
MWHCMRVANAVYRGRVRMRGLFWLQFSTALL